MNRRPQRALFAYAFFLLISGLGGFALSGFDTAQHIHGLRFAMVILVGGLLAGRVQRSRTLAFLAIDFSMLMMLALGLNYARLAFKWHGIGGSEWYTPYLAGCLSAGSVIFIPILLGARRGVRGHADWWGRTPLLGVAAATVWFSRRRHGLDLTRRAATALGAVLLTAGLIATNSTRIPMSALARVSTAVDLLYNHGELIGEVLANPDQISNLLDDPELRDTLEQIAEESGLLDDPELRALAATARTGDIDSVVESIESRGVSSILAAVDRADVDLDSVRDAAQHAIDLRSPDSNNALALPPHLDQLDADLLAALNTSGSVLDLDEETLAKIDELQDRSGARKHATTEQINARIQSKAGQDRLNDRISSTRILQEPSETNPYKRSFRVGAEGSFFPTALSEAATEFYAARSTADGLQNISTMTTTSDNQLAELVHTDLEERGLQVAASNFSAPDDDPVENAPDAPPTDSLDTGEMRRLIATEAPVADREWSSLIDLVGMLSMATGMLMVSVALARR